MKSQKFLGVTIDQFFNWKEHIDGLSVKLQCMGYVSRKLGKYTDINTVKTAYFAYIESRLTYGVLAWGCASKESIDKVFKKQKKIIRIIKKADKYASCRDSFVELKLLTLSSIIIKQNCIYVKEHLN